jgi:hypothetical protein
VHGKLLSMELRKKPRKTKCHPPAGCAWHQKPGTVQPDPQGGDNQIAKTELPEKEKRKKN